MSITSSMSSALSGLTAAARSAELVSSNISNSLTDGYVRRELQITARVVGDTGQGVQINGVSRDVNTILLGERRLSDASAGEKSVRAEFLQKLERTLGSPDNAASLTGRIASFDAALISASAQPESTAQLSGVLDAAVYLAESMNSISTSIQTARSNADAAIKQDVDTLNSALRGIAEMNRQIVALTTSGRDSSALQDQRQALVDQIATILPVRETMRENGRIALYTSGGAVLLEGLPPVFEFTQAGVISPDMTLASGALSGLTLNGQVLRLEGNGPIRGGSLAGNFAIRDELAPEAQAQLDAVALDLLDRFADPALDASRLPGDPGLFTDLGAAFAIGDDIGLSQRLRVNSVVDPANGGALWRLRDGLGATTPGPAGQSTLLVAMHDAIGQSRAAVSGGFLPGNRSLSMLAAQMASSVAADRLSAESEDSFAKAQSRALTALEQEGGVDTDRELQDLLVIEKAYAANAKVIQTVDGLLELLLGM